MRPETLRCPDGAVTSVAKALQFNGDGPIDWIGSIRRHKNDEDIRQNGKLHVVGVDYVSSRDDDEGRSPPKPSLHVSKNLLTGDIVKELKTGDSHPRSIKSKNAVEPLYLADYTGAETGLHHDDYADDPCR